MIIKMTWSLNIVDYAVFPNTAVWDTSQFESLKLVEVTPRCAPTTMDENSPKGIMALVSRGRQHRQTNLL